MQTDNDRNEKQQIVTCKRCHANIPEDQAEYAMYRGKKHVICHACLAELEKQNLRVSV